jgi:hypothetical protein
MWESSSSLSRRLLSISSWCQEVEIVYLCSISCYTRDGINFFIELFQWFLIVLSVRPSKIFAISAHRLPSCYLCIKKRICSSWVSQGVCLIIGFRWLCQRSRHYFPRRLGTSYASMVQWCAPYTLTKLTISKSSWDVQTFARVPVLACFNLLLWS